MPEQIPAFDTATGQNVAVSRRWVDNPGIANGRYVSRKPKTKTSRSKREPVDRPEVADSVTDTTDTPPIDGDSTEEIS